MKVLRILGIALFVAACSGGPILANAPVQRASPVPTPVAIAAAVDPQPITFPRDDGPHRRLTEWWYYTGHLVSDAGRQFGFEFVVFRAERGTFPVSWASHLALTDEQGRRFLYGQRSEIGPQVDASLRGPSGEPEGFALALTGFDPSNGRPNPGTPWTMRGAGGRDHLGAALSAAEAGPAGGNAAFGLALDLATDRPAVLHDRIGYIDFGPAGGSYYYSRPRMSVSGTLQLESETLHVSGTAWFDHQWGDFIAVGGGWDWFAVNLADGTDLTLSLVRDASGAHPLVYGTLVRPDGTFEHLDRDAFSVEVLGTWTSPRSGATYPAGWRIRVPDEALEVTLEPTVADQELDTRATTGVVYWEGSQRVTGTRQGSAVTGEAYVELTGYPATVATSP